MRHSSEATEQRGNVSASIRFFSLLHRARQLREKSAQAGVQKRSRLTPHNRHQLPRLLIFNAHASHEIYALFPADGLPAAAESKSFKGERSAPKKRSLFEG